MKSSKKFRVENPEIPRIRDFFDFRDFYPRGLGFFESRDFNPRDSGFLLISEFLSPDFRQIAGINGKSPRFGIFLGFFIFGISRGLFIPGIIISFAGSDIPTKSQLCYYSLVRDSGLRNSEIFICPRVST